MKNLGFILFLVILGGQLISCNPPRDLRKTDGELTDESTLMQNYNLNQTPGQYYYVPTNQTESSSQGSSESETTTTVSFPVGFEHCTTSFAVGGQTSYQFSSSSNAANLGSYNICKGNNNDRLMIQFQAPITGQICFVGMTYSDVTGVNKATAVSYNPSCRTFPDAGAIVEVPLNHERTNYQSAPIKSVMIMRHDVGYYGYPFNQYLNNLVAFYHCINSAGTAIDYCTPFKDQGRYVHHLFN